MKQKSNIKIISNIMLQDKYKVSPSSFVPWELLRKEERDVRYHPNLTPHQLNQLKKHLWYAKRIENDDGTVTILNENAEVIKTITEDEYLVQLINKSEHI